MNEHALAVRRVALKIEVIKDILHRILEMEYKKIRLVDVCMLEKCMDNSETILVTSYHELSPFFPRPDADKRGWEFDEDNI